MDREVDDRIGGRLKVDAFLDALGQECGVDHGGFVQMRTCCGASVLRAIFTQEATPAQGGHRTVLPSISRCHADDQQSAAAAAAAAAAEAAASSKQQAAASSSSEKLFLRWSSKKRRGGGVRGGEGF